MSGLVSNAIKCLLVLTVVCGLIGVKNLNADDGNEKSVVLIGDSIRMAYEKNLKKNLKGKAVVWAPKGNCQGSDFVLANLGEWLKDKNPDVIYLNCGLHDMFLWKPDRCKRTLEQYAANLKQIFMKIKELNNDSVIVFALTTPVDEEKQKTSKIYGRLVRKNSDIEKYNAKASEIAQELGIVVDDLNKLLKNSKLKEINVSDGIHLTLPARELLGKHVADIIEKNFKK